MSKVLIPILRNDELCGPSLREQIGQTCIVWRLESSETARAGIRKAMRAPRPRTYRVSSVRRRAQWEAHGLASIQAAAPEAPCTPYIVRIYYRSLGDEILAFEFTSNRAAAERYVSHHSCRNWYNGNSSAHDASMWRADGDADPMLYKARLITLPSQMDQSAELAKLPITELALAA